MTKHAEQCETFSRNLQNALRWPHYVHILNVQINHESRTHPWTWNIMKHSAKTGTGWDGDLNATVSLPVSCWIAKQLNSANRLPGVPSDHGHLAQAWRSAVQGNTMNRALIPRHFNVTQSTASYAPAVEKLYLCMHREAGGASPESHSLRLSQSMLHGLKLSPCNTLFSLFLLQKLLQQV